MKSTNKSLAATLVTLLVCTTANAEPPVWIVSDDDSRMLLFPTVHALPDGIDWNADELANVIGEADDVWLEIDASDQAAMALEVQALVAEYGLSPEQPLSKRLSATELDSVTKAADLLGIPMTTLEPMRPWLAALVLAQAELARAGFAAERGVEMEVLARLDGRAVRALETAVQQTRMLADMDAKTEIAFLLSTADAAGTGGDRLREITARWADGDLDGLETVVVDELRDDFPSVYQRVIVQRNEAWAELLDAELKASGTDFVAVGAGHLLGADSVPNLLKARGYTVERVSFGSQ